jgi:O-antigen/teichoic acid export membrane protein
LFHIGLLLRAGGALAGLVAVFVAVHFFGARPLQVALIQLAIRLVEFGVQWAMLRTRGLHVPCNPLRKAAESMKPYFISGLEFMLFPLGEAILLQGMVIVVGLTMSASMVAMFTTHRTLSRLTSQFLQIAVNPLRAEAGLLQAEDQRKELAFVVCTASRVTFWVSLALAGLLIVLGPTIFAVWTHHQISYSASLLFGLVAGTVAECLWRVASSVRLGTNRHRPLATGFLLCSLLGMAVAMLAGRFAGLAAMSYGIILTHLAMCLVTIPLTTPLIGMTIPGYLRAVVTPPLAELRYIFGFIRKLLT